MFFDQGIQKDVGETRSRRSSTDSSSVESFEVVDYDHGTAYSSSNEGSIVENDDQSSDLSHNNSSDQVNQVQVTDSLVHLTTEDSISQISQKSPKSSFNESNAEKPNEEPEPKITYEAILNSKIEDLQLELTEMDENVSKNKENLTEVKNEVNKMRNEVQITSSRLEESEKRLTGKPNAVNGVISQMNHQIGQTSPKSSMLVQIYTDPCTENILICSTEKFEVNRRIRVCIRPKAKNEWNLEVEEDIQDFKQQIIELLQFVGPNFPSNAFNEKLMKTIDMKFLIGFTTIPSLLNSTIEPVECVFNANGIAFFTPKDNQNALCKIYQDGLDLEEEDDLKCFKILTSNNLEKIQFLHEVQMEELLHEEMRKCSLKNDKIENQDEWPEIDENETYKNVSLEVQSKMIDKILARLRHPDSSLHLSAVQQARKLLCRSNSQFSIQVFIDSGILEDLAQCLKSENYEIKAEAAWTLTNIANGNTQQAEALVKSGSLPHFIVMLSESCAKLRDHAVWAISNIIGDSKPLRDLCLTLGIIHELRPLIKLTNRLMTNTTLCNICWLLTNLSRIPMDRENAIQLLPLVEQAFEKEPDADGLFDLFWTLNLLADLHVKEIVKDEKILKHVMIAAKKYLDYIGEDQTAQSTKIQYVVIQVLNKAIVKANPEVTNMLVDQGLMKLLDFNLDSRNDKTLRQSIQILKFLINKQYVNFDILMKSKLLDKVIRCCRECDDLDVSMSALLVLAYVFDNSNREQMNYLVKNEVFQWILQKMRYVFEKNRHDNTIQLLHCFDTMSQRFISHFSYEDLKSLKLEPKILEKISKEKSISSVYTDFALRVYKLLLGVQ